MREVIIIKPPLNCWENGYPVHKGENEASINYATLKASEQGLKADSVRLIKEYDDFHNLLLKVGLKVHCMDFPSKLIKANHDGVFVRDSGLLFENKWIKANFSCNARSLEADEHAKAISKKFNLEVINMPSGALLEFGETFYLKTTSGSFYFGGISRANKKGHEFVKNIIKPNNYLILPNEGYHLDTVFSPVIDKNNDLVAILYVKERFSNEAIKKLESLGVELIEVGVVDSSGEGETLGNYAINGFITPGYFLSCSKFLTKGVEDKLTELGVKHLVSPLTDFGYAGGSYHCLTNEVNK